MRKLTLPTLLLALGCADVLGIDEAHQRDAPDKAEPGPVDSTRGGSSSSGEVSEPTDGGGAGKKGATSDDEEEPVEDGGSGSSGSAGTTSQGGAGSDEGTAGMGGSAASAAGTSGAAGSGGSAGSGGAGGSGSSGGSAGASSEGGSGGSPEPAPTCATYCATVTSNCAGSYAQYSSEAECLSVCAALPPGGTLPLAENTVRCRLGHAALAALDPAGHCEYAGPVGNGQCGTNCDGYCEIVLDACTAPTAKHPFQNLAKCLDACSAFGDLGDYGASATYDTGKTVQCTARHASRAFADPVAECESAVGRGACEKP